MYTIGPHPQKNVFWTPSKKREIYKPQKGRRKKWYRFYYPYAGFFYLDCYKFYIGLFFILSCLMECQLHQPSVSSPIFAKKNNTDTKAAKLASQLILAY